MTSLEYLTSKKITPVIRIVDGSNKAEAFVTMTIEQFEEIQKDAWNAAIDAAAENAETLDIGTMTEEGWVPYEIVDKESILKLKR